MYHPAQEDGSPPFILDVCTLDTPTGLDTVSCGEDGSVCVWQGTELLQSIPHPTSVWCACGIPSQEKDGDFVTCSHDGFLRLFSKRTLPFQSLVQEERLSVLQINFLHQVEEAKQRRRKGPSEEEISKAAKWDDRGQHPGKSEGQVSNYCNT
jgi:WD40 repeat protein